MPASRTLGLLAVFAVCFVQIAVACDNGSKSDAGQSTKDDRTVLLSVVVANSGIVREVKVLNGPTALQTAAIEAARRRKYRGKAINNWGTTPVGKSARRAILAVTFPQEKGVPPKIQQAMPAGVSACLPAPTRVRVSQAFMGNRLLHRVEPIYPPEWQGEHVSGVVVVRVVIDKGGSILQADYVSGPTVLVPPAIEAVMQWKYQPYLLNGEAVEVESAAEISFTP
jgi:outer membrane biosynthesis protein TonB